MMTIECNIVVLLLQGLCFKRNKIQVPIPWTIRLLHFEKTLCDLRRSTNLMPLSIYKKLVLGDPKPTAMRLLMADRILKRPIKILHEVLVKVE